MLPAFILQDTVKTGCTRPFSHWKRERCLNFQKQNEDMADFLYLDDLGELIFRIFDNWDQDDRSLEIPDVFHIR